jgi:hypothetical protein
MEKFKFNVVKDKNIIINHRQLSVGKSEENPKK